MHQTVEMRATKKYNKGNAATASLLTANRGLSQDIPLLDRTTNHQQHNSKQLKYTKSQPITHDYHRLATERKFKEVLSQQLKLLNFHRKQFEKVLSSEMDASYLPEQVKTLLTSGLQGIEHYLAMLESVNQRH